MELGGDAFIGPERKPPGYVELDRNKPTLKKIYPNLKTNMIQVGKTNMPTLRNGNMRKRMGQVKTNARSLYQGIL